LQLKPAAIKQFMTANKEIDEFLSNDDEESFVNASHDAALQS
jgi:hypothetical protein